MVAKISSLKEGYGPMLCLLFNMLQLVMRGFVCEFFCLFVFLFWKLVVKKPKKKLKTKNLIRNFLRPITMSLVTSFYSHLFNVHLKSSLQSFERFENGLVKLGVRKLAQSHHIPLGVKNTSKSFKNI